MSDPGFNSGFLRGDFSRSSSNGDLKIGTLVATLLGARRYRVCAGTGWPRISLLWPGEIERLICNFYLSVAAREIAWADPSLRCTSLLLGCNNNNNCIQRHHLRFFTISSLRHEPSPTRRLKWPRRNHVQIMRNTSCPHHVQHVVFRATWYEGTAQLLRLPGWPSG